VTFRSYASAEFWALYAKLPHAIQKQATKQFALFQDNPLHPSLRLKQIGSVWSVRITRSCRALAYRKQNSFYWFWIGLHDDYEEMLEQVT
jgi:hypothetical protein